MSERPIRNSIERCLATMRGGLDEFYERFGQETALADNFARAVVLIANSKGRVIVSGIGKSGHIGRKIAATLASTGTPAFTRAGSRLLMPIIA